MLPGINGTEICQLIKLNKATQNLPVIMCSGEDDIDESLKQKGAPDDVLHARVLRRPWPGAKLADFEAHAVQTYANIMNALGVSP